MASLTSIDNKNITLFVTNQKKIFRRNRLIKSAPHIGSHTVTRVWRCTDEYAYRDPIELDPRSEEVYEREEGVKHEDWTADLNEVTDMAVVVDWFFDKTGCNTISCNPYYPGKGVCKGFDKNTVNEKEEPFAFTTGHNQRVDVCQPVCYDEDQTENTYVGMMSLYSSNNHMCFVTDPMLIAFYLDPHRRVFDEKEDIIERSAFKVGLEYLGPTGVPAVVAKIDEKYCEQYGLDYVEEKDETDYYSDGSTVYGRCKVDKDEGAFTALSTWTGDTITRGYNFGRDAVKSLIKKTSSRTVKEPPPTRGPTTQKYLADEKQWRSNVDETKKQLPFPLKLTDLGLHDKSDGLMWTDEYSYMDDGRNDAYGGRLVEKPRSISRPPWSVVKFDQVDFTGSPAKQTAIIRAKREAEARKSSNSVLPCETSKTNCELTEETERKMLLSIGRNVDVYKKTVSTMSGLKESVAGSSSLKISVDQLIAGTAVETAGSVFAELGTRETVKGSDILKQTVKSLMSRRDGGGAVSTKGIGMAMTQTAVRTGIETRVVTSSASLLKLTLRTLSHGANVLTLVSLFGAALDLLSAFVYNPYSKYERYMSDRLLRALAEAELITTQRLIGCQRLLLEPFDWIVNTRYLDPAEDSMYDMLLGMIYTRARRVNSDGSMIYWFSDGGLRRDNDGRLIYFDKSDEVKIKSDSLDRVLETFEVSRISDSVITEASRGKRSEKSVVYDKCNFISWYVIFVFVLFAAIAWTGIGKTETTRWMIPANVLAAIVSLGI